ncbi:MAG: hypothetical protein RMJ98_23200, partial [Myxococcales bacterium]|nr:hypothetical protein [Myxococcales bacterium]
MPLPRLFAPPMTLDRDPLTASILRAAQARRALAEDPRTSAFRIAHEGELVVPGLALDLYEDFFVAHFSSPESVERAQE